MRTTRVIVYLPDGAEHGFERATFEYLFEPHPDRHRPEPVPTGMHGPSGEPPTGPPASPDDPVACLVVHGEKGDAVYHYGEWESVTSQTVDLAPVDQPQPLVLAVVDVNGRRGTALVVPPGPGWRFAEQDPSPSTVWDVPAVDPDGRPTSIPVELPVELQPVKPAGGESDQR